MGRKTTVVTAPRLGSPVAKRLLSERAGTTPRGASGMHQSNVALGIVLLTAFSAILGFVAGYALRSYISYRRHQKFGWYRRSDLARH